MTAIKERPILFSAPMVRAILEGRKSVTRRAMKVQPVLNGKFWQVYGAGWSDGVTSVPAVTGHSLSTKCPYGKPGDRLWVRETFALLGNEDGMCTDWNDRLIKGDERDAARIFRASCTIGDYGLWDIPCKADWKPDTEEMSYDGAWRPSIHMPRWASRILLEITDVRVERLQDITPEQVTAEGVSTRGEAMWGSRWWVDAPEQAIEDARKDFADLWTSTGGNWDANPWVWVVEFKRVTP